jgi:hypothetical protein
MFLGAMEMTERKFFNDFIRLCKDADALISEVNSKSSTFKHLKPTSKKSAAIHYLAVKRKLPIRLNDLYFIYGSTQQTIIGTKRLIKVSQSTHTL